MLAPFVGFDRRFLHPGGFREVFSFHPEKSPQKKKNRAPYGSLGPCHRPIFASLFLGPHWTISIFRSQLAHSLRFCPETGRHPRHRASRGDKSPPGLPLSETRRKQSPELSEIRAGMGKAQPETLCSRAGSSGSSSRGRRSGRSSQRRRTPRRELCVELAPMLSKLRDHLRLRRDSPPRRSASTPKRSRSSPRSRRGSLHHRSCPPNSVRGDPFCRSSPDSDPPSLPRRKSFHLCLVRLSPTPPPTAGIPSDFLQPDQARAHPPHSYSLPPTRVAARPATRSTPTRRTTGPT